MMIRLKYGTYEHNLGEASVSITRQSLLTDSGVPYSWLTTWDIRGTLKGTSQADVGTKINALVNAYATLGGDAKLVFDNGSDTVHVIDASNTIGGIRLVRPPAFPVGDGAEYSLYRNYSVTLEAEEEISYAGGAFGASDIIQWQETVEISGDNGPRKAVIEVLNGLPQEQVLTSHSAVYAVQRGSAVGRASYPNPASPLWPAAEQGGERRIVRTSPEAKGPFVIGLRSYRMFRIEWSYSFLAATPLAALPTYQT